MLDPAQRKKYLKELETEMLKCAKELNFEQAVVLRDEIKRLKNQTYSS